MDWQPLLSTFGLLFLAELGDKTQLAVVTQVCRFRRPWAVFGGASLALSVITALGVLLGQTAGHLFPTDWVRPVAAAGFLLIGVWTLWSSWRGGATEDPCPSDAPAPCSPWRAFGATFGLLFLAELGDKTQLVVLAQAAQAVSPWAVLAGAALALSVVTALGVLFGQGLLSLVPERWLRRAAGIAFIGMGLGIGWGVV